MIRKFKALGLSVLTVMAVSAIGAQAAYAVPELTAAGYTATLDATGEKIGERFVTEAGAVECQVSHYSGSLAAPSSTFTIAPTFTACQAFGFLNATVTTTGCDLLFHATERVKENHYKAHVDVNCEAGKAITITAGTCTVQIHAQSNLTTVEITNRPLATPADIGVTPRIKGMKYTVTQDGFGCPFSGTGEKTGGEYLSNEGEANKITIRCTKPSGTFIGCSVSSS